MSAFITWIGGRKFLGFLLTLCVIVLFVMTDHLTDETIIRDLLVAAPAIFGLCNVAQKSKLVQPATSPKEPSS